MESIIFLRTNSQEVNNSKSTTTYYANGNVASVTDPKGNTTRYYYEKLNLLTKTETPFEKVGGTTVYSISKTDYYNNGNVKSNMNTINKPGEAEKYSKTEYEYNGRNLLSTVIQYDNGEKVNYTHYYYDGDGNNVRMYTGLNKPLTINGLDNVQTNGDADYSVTKYDYNYLGNLSKMIDPMGRLEKETWSNGVVKHYTYYGNLNSVETMDVRVNEKTHMKMSYKYDEYMRRWKVYEDFINVATYSYDENSNLDTIEYTNGNFVDYDYNYANILN